MASRFGFDLRSLEVFSEVAKTGNMSQAAEQLGMTQSSVSQTLANLEDSLETQLFDRSIRPMELTVGGRFLQDCSSRLIQEAQKTRQAFKKSHYNRVRRLNIALVDSLATAVGRSLVNSLKSRAQDWSISTGLSHMHGDALLTRKTDIIISDDALDDYPNMEHYQILREPFVLALPIDYSQPVADLKSLSAEMDFIRYPSHTLIARRIERYLSRVNVEPAERLQLDNSNAIVEAVSSGLGWTITTPLCIFHSGIRLHHVQLRRLPMEPFFRTLTLTARREDLGDLPEKIANDSIEILKRHFLSELTEEQPWLEEMLTLG